MTNDETQRKMDFILDRQAQFSSDTLRLKKRHWQAVERFKKIEDILTQLDRAILRLNQRND
jgi:hypothetical protein